MAVHTIARVEHVEKVSGRGAEYTTTNFFVDSFFVVLSRKEGLSTYRYGFRCGATRAPICYGLCVIWISNIGERKRCIVVSEAVSGVFFSGR